MGDISGQIVVLGDQNVGKTTIVERLVYKHFRGSRPHDNLVITPQFLTTNVDFEGVKLALKLWDIPAAWIEGPPEGEDDLFPHYVSHADVILIMYVITDKTTWKPAHGWLERLREVTLSPDCAVYLVGNKWDELTSDDSDSKPRPRPRVSEPSENIIATTAEDPLVKLTFEISCKSDKNVGQLFKDMFQHIKSTKLKIKLSARSTPGKHISPKKIIHPHEGEIKAKVILVGSSNSGKTCLATRYVDEKFDADQLPTLHRSLYYKTEKVDKESLRLEIWDTAGSEQYKSLTNMRIYFRQAKLAIVCFDLTDKRTWSDIPDWLYDVSTAEEECKTILVGTKEDLISGSNSSLRAVEKERASHLAASYANMLGYYEVSSKTGHNIDKLFHHIAREVLKIKHREQHAEHKGERIKLAGEDEDTMKSSKCC